MDTSQQHSSHPPSLTFPRLAEPLTRRPYRQACEPCRKRKVRCDGAVPCGACEKSRLKCQYPPSKPIGSIYDATSISSSTSSSISTSSSASSSASTEQEAAPSTATSTSTPYHFIPNNLQHHQHHHHPQPHPPMATTTTTQTTTPMVVVMAPHQQYQSHPPSQPPTLAPSLMHASFIPSSNVVFSTPAPAPHLISSTFVIDPHALAAPTALDEFEELVPLETRLFLLDFARTRQPVEFAGIERLFAPRKIGDLDASSALWLRMTFYSLMAMASRMSRRSTYENLIADRIRWLARQLFDQPHPGTAAAFLFAAYYFSIVSDEVSDCYTRAGITMCEQLQERALYFSFLLPSASTSQQPHDTSSSSPSSSTTPPFSIDSADFLLQLQIFATSQCGFRSAPWKIQFIESVLARLTQLSQDDITPIAAPYQLYTMRLVVFLRLKIAQALNRVVIGRDILMSELQLSYQDAASILAILDVIEESPESRGWSQPIHSVLMVLFLTTRVLAYIASRQYEACLALLSVMLTFCETHECHFEHAQPMLPELMFWMVHVCRTLNQPLLARRAVSILEKLVQVYTAGAHFYHDALLAAPPLPPLSLRRGEGAFASQLNNRELFRAIRDSMVSASVCTAMMNPLVSGLWLAPQADAQPEQRQPASNVVMLQHPNQQPTTHASMDMACE